MFSVFRCIYLDRDDGPCVSAPSVVYVISIATAEMSDIRVAATDHRGDLHRGWHYSADI